MTGIALEGVSKTFLQSVEGGPPEPVRAVDNLSLQVRPGEVLAVVGPSGCGKTTLLRLIGGLETPDEGRVLYNGIDLASIPPMERGIGIVFQDRALAPHWKTRRSVGFFLELRHREHELDERLKRIAQITGLGLEKLLTRRPGKLSRGEQQRVSIARALARDLRVLLFDEPFASLDAKLRAEARVELRRLLHEFPVTTVYVTHDQIEAMALASRIAVMNRGRLEQIGTYRQLYDTPTSMFVAGFIGNPPTNLFEGQVQAGRWQGQNFGGLPIRKDLADGTPVTLGVRPEHVHLAAEGTVGEVEIVTPLYQEKRQIIGVRAGTERWTLLLPLEQRLVPGAVVSCTFPPEQALFFDTATGQRIG
ncbi:MAG: ABC transporter ATP-binding protein [Anaerolineae bacterium]